MWTVIALLCGFLSSSIAHDSSTSYQESFINQTCHEDSDLWHCLCLKHNMTMFNGIVKCSYFPESGIVAFVENSYCVTHIQSNRSLELVAGMCPFNNPPSLRLLNNVSNCRSNKHMGTLCGKCSVNNSLAVNSFGLNCIESKECPQIKWFLYFAEHFIPVTIIYLIVVVFNIRAMDERANAFILYAQVIALELNLFRIYKSWMLIVDSENISGTLTKIIGVMYGILNLDISLGLFPKMCLPGNLTAMGVFSLHYATAIYPLFLVLVTHVLAELHAKKYRILVCLYKPIHICLARFRRKVDRKNSIINAFATLLLLSYAKFTTVSFILLAPTTLTNIDGKFVRLVYLFDGGDYFQPHHLVYTTAAVLVLMFVVFPLPILLLLYPMQCFQKCLKRLKLRCQFITIFASGFQACYKDGSVDGTRDCRYFSGLYFIIRIFLFATSQQYPERQIHGLITCVLLIVMTALLAVYRPYKKDIYNKLDILIFLFFILLNSLLVFSDSFRLLGVQILIYVLLLLPGVIWLCSKMLVLICRFCCGRRHGWHQFEASSTLSHSQHQSYQYSLFPQPRSGSYSSINASLRPISSSSSSSDSD